MGAQTKMETRNVMGLVTDGMEEKLRCCSYFKSGVNAPTRESITTKMAELIRKSEQHTGVGVGR